MGGPWVYRPPDPAHGYTSVYTEADVEACLALPWWDHYGTTIYYIPWGDPASTALTSFSTQEHNANRISLHPVIVGPILYCFYILWHSSRSKHKQYGYSDASYNPAVLDWASEAYSSPSTAGPPPVTGSQLYENDINFPPPQDELYAFSTLVKACVYTKEALEEAKAAVDGADAKTALDMCIANQHYVSDPLWGYPTLNWLPNAPGEMQERLTSHFLNHQYGDEIWFADDYDDITMKTRPHTKAELQEAGMWPKEA
jgi:hypothetical protein